MKLWCKISIICISILLLIVFSSDMILLIESKDKILQNTLDNAMAKQHDLSSSFSEMVMYYGGGEPEMDAVTKYSMSKYCFSRFADQTSVLVSGSQTVYSNMALHPEAILPITELRNQQSFFGMVGGKNILIVGSRISVLSDEYGVYSVQDITPVYNSIHNMIWMFILIGLGFIAVGIALIVALVRIAMRPMKELGIAAQRISQGNYCQRAAVRTNDEVGALARDFNRMAKAIEEHIAQLRETSERQQLFIGGLTHEFKTPLTSLIGHSDTLLYSKQPAKTIENSLFQIHEQCYWLERLTQKLLKLIELQEDLTLAPMPVQALFESVRESVSESFQSRGTALVVSCEIETLPMDADLLRSALINLCDNASKASEPGQTVELHAYGLTIEVADHGCGIPKDEIARITEPFYTVDRSRSKKKGGSGLGLALVKQIAQAHGAQLQFESSVKNGTIARIVFPKTNN